MVVSGFKQKNWVGIITNSLYNWLAITSENYLSTNLYVISRCGGEAPYLQICHINNSIYKLACNNIYTNHPSIYLYVISRCGCKAPYLHICHINNSLYNWLAITSQNYPSIQSVEVKVLLTYLCMILRHDNISNNLKHFF